MGMCGLTYSLYHPKGVPLRGYRIMARYNSHRTNPKVLDYIFPESLLLFLFPHTVNLPLTFKLAPARIIRYTAVKNGFQCCFMFTDTIKHFGSNHFSSLHRLTDVDHALQYKVKSQSSSLLQLLCTAGYAMAATNLICHYDMPGMQPLNLRMPE